MSVELEYNPEQAKGLAQPIGEFVATIIEAKSEISKNSGNPMLALILRIGDGDKYEDVWVWVVFTAKSMKNVKLFLDAVGGYDTSKRFFVEPEKLVGEQIRIITKEDEYNGNPTARVDKWLPLKSQSDNAPDDIPMEYGKGKKGEDSEEVPF